MKQILQDLKNGDTIIENVPCPQPGQGQILIATQVSLVSAGTERMLVEFGKGNLFEKARQQPDKVRQVLDKVKTDGIVQTIDTVRNKLDQALPMGYCNVGKVIAVGAGVTEFNIGDRVVSNGKHAERVVVPVNLCAKIPDGVDDESAVFTVLAAIALHGVRLAEPTIGERFVVLGLGLVGLLTAQILIANGCYVLGFDFDKSKIELAKEFGINGYAINGEFDPLKSVLDFTRNIGADGVIVAASTASSDPMRNAVKYCRKKGRVVQVGLTGMELSRADMFEKEVSVKVSCSYGPGRYDPFYEDAGNDYPIAYVRWTEKRNFEAILALLNSTKLRVAPLISHRFPIEKAQDAYKLIASGQQVLGILIQYPQSLQEAASSTKIIIKENFKSSSASVAFIGAGAYATQILMPAFAKTEANLVVVASNTGVSAIRAARKFGFSEAISESEELFLRNDVDTLIVATRHNSHASFVCKGLRAGKHVFVEKPLAVTEEELSAIEQTYRLQQESGNHPKLMVGFNRRFAPHSIFARKLLGETQGPKSFVYTVNAGAIPTNHWTQEKSEGGGRILGEACHFIDLLRFFANSEIVSVHAISTPLSNGRGISDNAIINLSFADGSIGVINYLSTGHRGFPKERIEIFCAGKIIQIENFRKIHMYGWKSSSGPRLWRQDKGNENCVKTFIYTLRNNLPSPIEFSELIEVSRIALLASEKIANLHNDNKAEKSGWF